MPRQKGDFDQTKYHVQYERDNLIQKKVIFNRKNEEDMILYDWAMSHKNFSAYIKGLISYDMNMKGLLEPES